jgi:tetratricopeptide (TPR) repeat protein
MSSRFACRCLCTLSLLFVGCSELRARSHAREGNEHFRAGDYAAAARAYGEAEALSPTLATATLNRGLACRQLILPGAKDGKSREASECALDAFAKLKQLRPDDPRGEQLHVQTLFDAERYEELAAMYRAELRERPSSLLALNGLIQVYTRWNRPEEALAWTVERAKQRPDDAEAQYAVGVTIFSLLLERGGGPDKASYDPRPDAAQKSERPLFGLADISGPRRVELANVAITHLERALTLRPSYREALVYLGLLERQKSFALFDRPLEWQAAVEAAERYRSRASALASAPHAGAR